MINDTLCIYHNDDLDGKCSAAIVYLAHEGQIDLKGLDHGDVEDPLPIVEKYKHLIMVDFSFVPAVMDKIMDVVDSFIWIDHHAKRIQEMSEQSDMYYTNEARNCLCTDGLLAACQLTWRYFFRDVQTPIAIDYLGMHDVWNHRDPNTLAFQYGIRSCNNVEPTSTLWPKIFLDKDIIDRLLEKGFTVLNYIRKDNEMRVHQLATPVEFEGYKALAVNYGPGDSDFFASLDASEYDLLILFYFVGTRKKWKVSLRTNKDIDLAALASKYGGGGHMKAAGFNCDELPFRLGD